MSNHPDERADRAQEIEVIGLYASIDPNSFVTTRQESLTLTLEGITGESRHPPGFTKEADGRDSGISRGTPVRNWRMWSALSVEESVFIAEALGIPVLAPELLGANILFKGMDGFTQLPRGTTLWFPRGVVLSVECENLPCMGPGNLIAESFAGVKASDFVNVAMGKRGLVGVVYTTGHEGEGVITVGDMVTVRKPRSFVTVRKG